VLEDSLLTPETVSWGSDGYLYGTALQNGITRREAHAGSKPEFVTTVDTAAGEQTHLYPELLPDGKTVLFHVDYRGGKQGIAVGVLGDRSTSHCSTAFALVMRRAATCCTRRETGGCGRSRSIRRPARHQEQRFRWPIASRDDRWPGRLRRVRNGYPGLFNGGCQHPSRADLGVAHRGAFTVRLDVEGRVLEPHPLGGWLPGCGLDPRGSESNIWIRPVAGGLPTKLTTQQRQNSVEPAWSPDGRWVSYLSGMASTGDVWRQRIDGSGTAERLLRSQRPLSEQVWSPLGNALIVRTTTGSAGVGDILLIHPGVDSAPTPLVTSAHSEYSPSFRLTASGWPTSRTKRGGTKST
jgi:hypothetical protein